jgi:hypothetical protein
LEQRGSATISGADDRKAAQDGGPLVELDRRGDRPVEPADAEDLRGRRRVDPLDAESSAQTLGDVAALAADRGFLQGHDIGTERGELLDDDLEPLVQVGAVADEPGPRASVQEVEGDHAYRLRLALAHAHRQKETRDRDRSPKDRAANDKIPRTRSEQGWRTGYSLSLDVAA